MTDKPAPLTPEDVRRFRQIASTAPATEVGRAFNVLLNAYTRLDAERAGAGRLREALADLDDWMSGCRSWVNLGPNPPYTPDVIAVMDAQEVVKRAAYVQAIHALDAEPGQPTHVCYCLNGDLGCGCTCHAEPGQPS